VNNHRRRGIDTQSNLSPKNTEHSDLDFVTYGNALTKFSSQYEQGTLPGTLDG